MVQDTGVETALPEPPAPVQATVEILGILPCQMLQESTDAAFHLTRYDEVDMSTWPWTTTWRRSA